MYAECPSLSDIRFDQIYGGTGTIINETKCAKNRLAYSFLVSSFWGNGLVSMITESGSEITFCVQKSLPTL